MFVYNISVQVNKQIETDWLQWQQAEHIPQIRATELFSECRLYKLLEHEHEDTSTYIIQYTTDTKEKYEDYVTKYAAAFQLKTFEKFGNSFIAFRTVMQQLYKN